MRIQLLYHIQRPNIQNSITDASTGDKKAIHCSCLITPDLAKPHKFFHLLSNPMKHNNPHPTKWNKCYADLIRSSISRLSMENLLESKLIFTSILCPIMESISIMVTNYIRYQISGRSRMHAGILLWFLVSIHEQKSLAIL